MCQRVVIVADGSSRACQLVEHYLMLGFLLTRRSVKDDPDGGFDGRRWGRRKKSSTMRGYDGTDGFYQAS